MHGTAKARANAVEILNYVRKPAECAARVICVDKQRTAFIWNSILFKCNIVALFQQLQRITVQCAHTIFDTWINCYTFGWARPCCNGFPYAVHKQSFETKKSVLWTRSGKTKQILNVCTKMRVFAQIIQILSVGFLLIWCVYYLDPSWK